MLRTDCVVSQIHCVFCLKKGCSIYNWQFWEEILFRMRHVFTFFHTLVSAAISTRIVQNFVTKSATINLMISVLWGVLSCNIIENYQRFGVNLEDGGSWFIRNCGNYQTARRHIAEQNSVTYSVISESKSTISLLKKNRLLCWLVGSSVSLLDVW
jgi:hypothetical protein